MTKTKKILSIFIAVTIVAAIVLLFRHYKKAKPVKAILIPNADIRAQIAASVKQIRQQSASSKGIVNADTAIVSVNDRFGSGGAPGPVSVNDRFGSSESPGTVSGNDRFWASKGRNDAAFDAAGRAAIADTLAYIDIIINSQRNKPDNDSHVINLLPKLGISTQQEGLSGNKHSIYYEYINDFLGYSYYRDGDLPHNIIANMNYFGYFSKMDGGGANYWKILLATNDALKAQPVGNSAQIETALTNDLAFFALLQKLVVNGLISIIEKDNAEAEAKNANNASDTLKGIGKLVLFALSA